MRQALIVSVVVLGALGVDLLLFPTRTDRYFSWPIAPALTSSALVADYLTATAVLVLALRGWTWAPVKVVLPGGIAFSALAVIATLMHFGKFNQNSDYAFARAMTWVWLFAYLILPPLLVIFWPSQARAPGQDPAPDPPPAWIPAAAGAIGLITLGVGLALFLVPDRVAELWPWTLTPLTGRVLGAWGVGLGMVFANAARSNDRMRMRGPVAGLALFGTLHLLAMARHGSDVAWGEPAAWVYAAFLAACLTSGAGALPRVWAADPARGAVLA
jgi:hypothetical protein